MKLSVIIPWHDNGDPYRLRNVQWLLDRYGALLPEAEIIVAGDDSEPFSRSKARNSGVSLSTGDILLLADADTVFQRDHIAAGLASLLGGAPWVIPYGLGRYYNMSQEESLLITTCAPDSGVPEPSSPTQWEHKLDSWAGLLLVPRAAFEKAGGYDERFVGWGYEDNAFRYAVDHAVGNHRRIDGYALHLWHPVTEEHTFGQPHILSNRELFRLYERGEYF